MMLLQAGLALVAITVPYIVLALCGVVLALRTHPLFSLYIVAGVARILTTIVVSVGTAGAQYSAFAGPLADHQETTMYAVSAVSWVDSAFGPAVILAAIVGPLLWQMRRTHLSTAPLTELD